MTSPRRLLLPVAALVAAMAVAACGSSSSPTPSAAPSLTPSAAASPAASASAPASAEASAAPSAAASTEPSAAASALPSIPIPSLSADKGLEALLPATYQGATLVKQSLKVGALGSGSSGADFQAMVTTLGVDPSTVTVAVALDMTGKSKVTFLAIRFPGADSGRLTAVLLAASQKEGTATQLTLGGKSVIKAATQASSDAASYFYVKNDTILGVSAASDADAGPALAVLP